VTLKNKRLAGKEVDSMMNLCDNEVLCRNIFDAIRINDLLAVKAYLVFGATVATRDAMGWTPLHYAAWHNHLEIFSHLLSQGADLYAFSKSGETPSHLALRNGSRDILAYLRELKKVA
jgi:ankyrin repeat protein